MDPETTTADSGFDVESAASSIGADLFDAKPEAVDDVAEDAEDFANSDDVTDAAPPPDADPEASETPATPPAVREPPKSWAKDKHALWATLTPEAQDYYAQREQQFLDGLEQYKGDATYARQLKDILTPYTPMLQAQGIEPVQAVQYLMNAHYRLTNGTEAERRAAYETIGRDLGFIQADAGQQGAIPNPDVVQLRQELDMVKSSLTARQQAEFNAAREKAQSEVDVFAADPVNAHFNDVAHDMVPLLKSGMSLKDAYDRAVWANPVTRAKELARVQTERETTNQQRAAEKAESAKRATAPNVRGPDARTAPTEPKGKFLDDAAMRADLRAIRSRT